MQTQTCRNCWWQESGRCYVGEPPREPNGVSKVMAVAPCDKWQSKVRTLEVAIPNAIMAMAAAAGIPKPYPLMSDKEKLADLKKLVDQFLRDHHAYDHANGPVAQEVAEYDFEAFWKAWVERTGDVL